MGTLINIALIVLGGLLGLGLGRRIKPGLQDMLMKANGVSTMFLAIAGAMSQMLRVAPDGSIATRGSVMTVVSVALGTVIGECLGIERFIEHFGTFLKEKTGSERDRGFVNAFVTASCTVCVGAMAVVGAIQDGVAGDPSILITKGILDFIIVCIMTTTLGKGCIFSAIPVGIVQFSVMLLAMAVSAFVPQAALDNLSLVGSVLIFCVGLNLVWDMKLRVANMLPAIVIAMLWAAVPI